MGFYPTPDSSESSSKPSGDPSSENLAQKNEWLTKLDLSGFTVPPAPPPKLPSRLNRIVFIGLIVFLVVLAGGAALSFYQQDQRSKSSQSTSQARIQAGRTTVAATQTAVQNAYGADILALCTKTKTTNRGVELPSGKVLVLTDNTTSIHTGIFTALPVNLRALDKKDLVAVACVKQNNQLYDTVKYTKDGVSRGTCQEWRVAQIVSLIDVKSGQVVESMSFLGPIPAKCPAMTTVRQGQNANDNRYGTAPAASVVANWLKQKMTTAQEAS